MSHTIGLLTLIAIVTVALAGCSPAADNGLVSSLSTQPVEVKVEMTPVELYDQLEARRVLLDGNALVLDTRNFGVGENTGRVTTDVIDLGSGAVVSLPVKITGLTVDVQADTPGKSKVTAALRHGPAFLPQKGWSDWKAIVPGQPVDIGEDRYIQLGIELAAGDAQWHPGVRGVTMSFTRQATMSFQTPVVVTAHEIEQITRSTVDFQYERMDQADLQWFRKAAKLDEVVAGKKSEFEKLVALNNWVAERNNLRDGESKKKLGWGREYPWNIRKVFDPAVENGSICGHCGSYAEVLVTAATAMGWQARHIANSGYRANSHEVVEIWVNELGKWVYFDPSLATYYVSTKDGKPLDIVEMHDLYVGFFIPDGKTLSDYPRREDKSKDAGYQRRLELDYANLHARPVTTDYTYGEKKPFPWQSAQGIMTCGWLQMTPRNNFHSKPQPVFTNFGDGADGSNGFPVWTDAKTPLRSRASTWHTRHRDWYWTLNQASIRLIRTGEDEIRVELGNSQPHFDHYRVTIDGQSRDESAAVMTWKLKSGRNTLSVAPVDALGQVGLASSVTVALK